jgi:alpha-L-arabinofuranosidase
VLGRGSLFATYCSHRPLLGLLAGPVPTLRIEVDSVAARVSPLHSGLMTEEVNHSYDGGLYAELISNRAFQDERINILGQVQAAAPLYWPPPHWTLISEGTGAAAALVDDKQPLNSAIKSTLRLSIISASPGNRGGIANDGFWGKSPCSPQRFIGYRSSPRRRTTLRVR